MSKTMSDILSQIKRLDTRLGVGIGAKKERAKLNKELEKAKVIKSEDKSNVKPSTQ